MHYNTSCHSIEVYPASVVMSKKRIGILTATMTGLAEMCAEEVEGALASAGLESSITPMDDLGVDALDGIDMIIIISSTYGHGDIPDNGQAFFSALDSISDLSGKFFAVFGLGDSTYADTFCHAGEKWDALLDSKGAVRLAPLERHDASGGTLSEDVAGAWAASWADALKQKVA